jgi:hopene-associated glycosyltransferase HpnB
VLPGWTGKLSALSQGLAAIADDPAPPDYYWFTDADIVHAPDSLSGLVATAEARGAVLVSLMARLRCVSPAERWLVPAFVFFFRKLYPFAWVSNPRRATAGAAGGCSLVRREALAAGGGLDAIRSSLIDDCALGAIMKKQGPTYLGLTHKVLSIRPYPHMTDIADMVTRSAYAQLDYSPLKLAGTVLGMILIYLVPPVLGIAGNTFARPLALAAYVLMVAAYLPMLRFYGLSRMRALALPLIAGLYTLFTIDSAIQHAMARGGAWKGRFQARPSPGRAR